MTVTLKQLQILKAVVAAGSIGKATRLAGLSQPSISQQIAKMEEDLGTVLINRSRTQERELTPAGEHWYRMAVDLLDRLNRAEAIHQQLYSDDLPTLRFGTTPSLRGRVMGAAAQVVVSSGHFSRFDYVWGMNSHDIVRMIAMHQIRCGIVSQSSILDMRRSLHVVPLFRDKIIWMVPRHIPPEIIAGSARTGRPPEPPHEALGRFVDVDSFAPWQRGAMQWYRSNLPFSVPYFGAMTHQAATDYAFAGLATCLTPLSLIPNLPGELLERVRLFDLNEYGRDVVFVMTKHLMSLPAFAQFGSELCDSIAGQYHSDAVAGMLEPLPFEIE